jgi:hypothetical protein
MPPRRVKDKDAAGSLTITAQQSRFHTEMDEDNNLKEASLSYLHHEETALTPPKDRRQRLEHIHW